MNARVPFSVEEAVALIKIMTHFCKEAEIRNRKASRQMTQKVLNLLKFNLNELASFSNLLGLGVQFVRRSEITNGTIVAEE